MSPKQKKLLEREIAESELAKRDWEELGIGDANPLTLRIPQLKEAEANVNAANANLERAKLNLERTIVTLPFEGIIKKKNYRYWSICWSWKYISFCFFN